MLIPPAADLRWRELLTRGRTHAHEFQFLALNLLLTGTSLSLKRDPGAANLELVIGHVRGLLERNAHLATVQHDLALIFGGD